MILKKIVCIFMVFTIMLVVNSNAFAAENGNVTKRIALVPVMHLNCHYNHYKVDEANLNKLFQREIHIPLNGLLKKTEEIVPEEVLISLDKNYRALRAVNKKAEMRDAIKAAADELNADIFILPIARNCFQETYARNLTGNIMVSRAMMELSVYDRRTGEVQTYRYYDHYNNTVSILGSVDRLLQNCAERVLKKADLMRVINGEI